MTTTSSSLDPSGATIDRTFGGKKGKKKKKSRYSKFIGTSKSKFAQSLED